MSDFDQTDNSLRDISFQDRAPWWFKNRCAKVAEELSDYGVLMRDSAAADPSQGLAKIESEIRVLTQFDPNRPEHYVNLAHAIALDRGDKQSEWEDALNRAKRLYYSLRRLSDGRNATENNIGEVLQVAAMMCQQFAQYSTRWARVRDALRRAED